MGILVIVLAVIAYYLWKIYQQREDERTEAVVAKHHAQQEQEIQRQRQLYPHLIGKLQGNWLDVFTRQAEQGLPLLKISFLMYLHESTKMELSQGAMKWDALWSLSEELLEHLDKYHEGSVTEHEIAFTTYWQIAATEVEKLHTANPEIEGSKLEVKPYTDISQIVSLFPKNQNHPATEMVFVDHNGAFPRNSEGSKYIKDKLHALGL